MTVSGNGGANFPISKCSQANSKASGKLSLTHSIPQPQLPYLLTERSESFQRGARIPPYALYQNSAKGAEKRPLPPLSTSSTFISYSAELHWFHSCHCCLSMSIMSESRVKLALIVPVMETGKPSP